MYVLGRYLFFNFIGLGKKVKPRSFVLMKYVVFFCVLGRLLEGERERESKPQSMIIKHGYFLLLVDRFTVSSMHSVRLLIATTHDRPNGQT